MPGAFQTVSPTTLPRAQEKAFLTAQLANTSDFILLSGEASTYVGDEYTGTTTIATLAPQESLEIGFGIDDRQKMNLELVLIADDAAGTTCVPMPEDEPDE